MPQSAATAPTTVDSGERSEVRDRIIAEATRLFAKQGYALSSVREITEAAGVTKPTLYYWFGSKEGLFTALVEHHISAWLRETAEIVHQPTPVVERLEAYVRSTFLRFQEQQEVARFLVMAFHQTGQGAPEVDTMRFHGAQVHLLIDLLKEGIASGELAPHDPASSVYLLMGAVQMRIGGALHAGHALEPDTHSKLLALFLHGVSR